MPDFAEAKKLKLEREKIELEKAKAIRESKLLGNSNLSTKVSLISVLITALIGLLSIFATKANNDSQVTLKTQEITLETIKFQQEEKLKKEQIRLEAAKFLAENFSLLKDYSRVANGNEDTSAKSREARKALVWAFCKFDEEFREPVFDAILFLATNTIERGSLQDDIDSCSDRIQATTLPDSVDPSGLRPINTANSDRYSTTNIRKEFKGNDRRVFSNELIAAYQNNKSQIAENLVNTIIGSGDKDKARWSYRVNLYVVYTLARIPGGWAVDNNLVNRVNDLKNSDNYYDQTFRKWTDQALENMIIK